MLVLSVFRGLEVDWLVLPMALYQNDLQSIFSHSASRYALWTMHFYIFLSGFMTHQISRLRPFLASYRPRTSIAFGASMQHDRGLQSSSIPKTIIVPLFVNVKESLKLAWTFSPGRVVQVAAGFVCKNPRENLTALTSWSDLAGKGELLQPAATSAFRLQGWAYFTYV
jgi:hypothetical protein